MSYYSILEIEGKISDVKGLKRAIKTIPVDAELSNMFDGMTISHDGLIEFNDWYAKWYYCDTFFEFMLQFAEDGFTCKFYGEDDTDWGYRKKGGKVVLLERQWKEVEE